ncbi:MAG: HrcA family transcriptional regulator [Dialister sp.]
MIEQPEFQNVERVQDILNLLEERDILESMLLSSMDKPIAVHIGSENLFKSFSDLSVVRAQFTSQGRVIGSVAVLGPTRMQYSKIIGMMYFMQQRLNTLLKEEE